MRTIQKTAFGFLALCLLTVDVFAQESPIRRVNINQVQIDQIIKEFTKNEEMFRSALTNYVFERKAKIQTIGLGGLITGTYRRDSSLTFNSEGKRFERIIYHPPSTLHNLQFTPEDLEDLGGVNPFAINPRNVSKYTFSYVGKQRVDELNLFVFDVRPRIIPNPKKSKERFFKGRIWVDDKDLLIVKSKGKGIPEGKQQRFPIVETWRINIDGKYWFPAYSAADDDLVFGNGQVIKIRMRVQYTNYKMGRSEVIILDDVDTPLDENKKDDPPKIKEN